MQLVVTKESANEHSRSVRKSEQTYLQSTVWYYHISQKLDTQKWLDLPKFYTYRCLCLYVMCEQVSTSVLLVKLFAMLDLQSLNFVLHFVVFTSIKIKNSLLYTCKGENSSQTLYKHTLHCSVCKTLHM